LNSHGDLFEIGKIKSFEIINRKPGHPGFGDSNDPLSGTVEIPARTKRLDLTK
jgi:hypothetical protein